MWYIHLLHRHWTHFSSYTGTCEWITPLKPRQCQTVQSVRWESGPMSPLRKSEVLKSPSPKFQRPCQVSCKSSYIGFCDINQLLSPEHFSLAAFGGWLCYVPTQASTLQLTGSHWWSDVGWSCSPILHHRYSQFHALNGSQKLKVTEPEVSQSGSLNFSKLGRIL